jgi:signal peptidase I
MRIFPENWRIAVIRTTAFVLVIILIRTFALQWFRAFGMSMEPTIKDGSIVLANKLVYRFRPVQRGDIVIFRTSNKPYVYFIKRVIAFPGEKVEFRNGKLFINDKEIIEPYIKERGDWNVEPFIVKEGHFFVCGDNRLTFWEGHLHPQISMKNIIGKAIGYK